MESYEEHLSEEERDFINELRGYAKQGEGTETRPNFRQLELEC